ncbi:hypothetical protein PPL_12451 [Heterostelium album PN500]|uniref:Uncharacterized protein n=1 Tax=Heterostelium pallidum (strain ATCC 26659 / Pp 5 / PN500) TaxID=670386 RepID=D3BMM8_HETP5|nr:hypothetical protein PPL_12451 [Heterostelium album PN500]EFA77240.1 hypothetical protein PPL_12451 [Heterostelium album PN500]|eukprot:XP_020429369.1 hypothetical protein PPL_12451 [Heterostelium album PN500]
MVLIKKQYNTVGYSNMTFKNSLIKKMKKIKSIHYVIDLQDIQSYTYTNNQDVPNCFEENFEFPNNSSQLPMGLSRRLSDSNQVLQPLMALIWTPEIVIDYIRFNAELKCESQNFTREIRIFAHSLVVVEKNFKNKSKKNKNIIIPFKDITDLYLDPNWTIWTIFLNNGFSYVFKLNYPGLPIHLSVNSLLSNYINSQNQLKKE